MRKFHRVVAELSSLWFRTVEHLTFAFHTPEPFKVPQLNRPTACGNSFQLKGEGLDRVSVSLLLGYPFTRKKKPLKGFERIFLPLKALKTFATHYH
jgi:hypothetical protein